ncbi:glutamate-rich protein GrpB [Candidatus Vecturithrix granuli]|uniref:Glutamate-rich protein GrpB n=1 Tax=Vecturithrix granuli TaxID=1499967 RepID=A0A081C0K5_VECG1|nr:glutamate-rich protein GrpB [Candidatus Vecturithrix granuli]
MIAIINSFFFPIVTEVTTRLAQRYDAGGGLDMHALAAKICAEAPENEKPGILFDEACQFVFSEKKQGIENFVISYTFDTPNRLKLLRGLLSRYDNEIYAFRLCFSPMVLTALLSPFPSETGHAYNHWDMQQEEGANIGDMGYEIPVTSDDPETIVQAIWDDIHEPVELSDYQSEWPDMFMNEKTRILNALHGMPGELEHIGSTAIPNMIAKPVLDMLLIIEDLRKARQYIRPLRELGYAFIDYPQNTTRLFFRKGKPRSHHIHIVEKESPAARDHLHFRNALLSDALLREEYLHLKQEALQEHQFCRALYGERKTTLIRKALARYRAYTKNRVS